MAVAAPARRSAAPATAPPPRTKPPRKRKPAAGPAAPARKRKAAAGSAVPARTPSRRKPATRPASPRRKAAPARRRTRHAAAAQPRLAIAVGRSAAAVRGLPDSGLVVRMTRGRAWIAVLGVLLVGIVGLNVVTLSFAASSSKVDVQNTALERENGMLQNREGTVLSNKRVHHEAGKMGLAMPTTQEPTVIEAGPHVVEEAAERLAEAG